jgi:hypothetical protein
MEILGHSQIAITMNLYSHVMPTMRAEVASRMDEILTRKPVAARVAATAEYDKVN